MKFYIKVKVKQINFTIKSSSKYTNQFQNSRVCPKRNVIRMILFYIYRGKKISSGKILCYQLWFIKTQLTQTPVSSLLLHIWLFLQYSSAILHLHISFHRLNKQAKYCNMATWEADHGRCMDALPYVLQSISSEFQKGINITTIKVRK